MKYFKVQTMQTCFLVEDTNLTGTQNFSSFLALFCNQKALEY